MSVGRLVLNAFYFCLLLLVFNLVSIAITRSLLLRTDLTFPTGTNTLVLGDSQVEWAVNDSLIPRTVNLAQGGEAYLYSYAKAKHFFEANPDLDTLWLSFNYMALDHVQDTLTRSDRYIKFKLPFNFFLLDATDACIFLGLPKAYITLAQTPFIRWGFIRKAVRGPTNYKDLNFGGYSGTTEQKLKKDLSVRANEQKLGTTRPPEFGAARDQVEYLQRTIDLCRANGVTCILLNTPVHPVAQKGSDTTAYYAYIQQHFPDQPFFDHSSWQFPDSCFRDAVHLNAHGATRYTTRLEKLRSKGWPTLDRQGRTPEERDNAVQQQ